MRKETATQRKRRLAKRRHLHRLRVERETPAEKERRLELQRFNARLLTGRESAEDRALRLQKASERRAACRYLKSTGARGQSAPPVQRGLQRSSQGKVITKETAGQGKEGKTRRGRQNGEQRHEAHQRETLPAKKRALGKRKLVTRQSKNSESSEQRERCDTAAVETAVHQDSKVSTTILH